MLESLGEKLDNAPSGLQLSGDGFPRPCPGRLQPSPSWLRSVQARSHPHRPPRDGAPMNALADFADFHSRIFGWYDEKLKTRDRPLP